MVYAWEERDKDLKTAPPRFSLRKRLRLMRAALNAFRRNPKEALWNASLKASLGLEKRRNERLKRRR